MYPKIQMIGILAVLLVFGLVGMAAAAGPEGEPELVFEYQATIDRISNNDIVLDDTWFKLAAHAVYYNKDDSPAYRSRFKVGVTVEFHVNNLEQVDALRLTK